MLGVEAELIFFNAAIFEPCQEDRDLFFGDLLRGCLQPITPYLQ